MTNFGNFARFGLAASVLTFALGVSAQSYPTGGVSPGGASSQTSPTGTPGATNRIDAYDATHSATASSQKEMDKAFVRKMIMGNHSEIDAGNLAVQKASSDEVKKFGQKMVDDHTMLLNDMTKLADDLHIKAPQTAPAKDKAMAAKLSAMSGTDFDKAYVKDMVKDHENDVAEVRKESHDAEIPQVKDAAIKALPILEGHLNMIKGIQKDMMGGSASTK